MNKKIILLLFLLFICTSFAFGYIYGGTNLGFGGYPEFSEYMPNEPISFDNSISEWEFDGYRDAVERFIDDAKAYIENGNYDIDRIKEAQNNAIDEANSVVRTFNRFAETVRIKSSF